MSIGAEEALGQGYPVRAVDPSALIEHVARLLAAEYMELMEAAANSPTPEEIDG